MRKSVARCLSSGCKTSSMFRRSLQFQIGLHFHLPGRGKIDRWLPSGDVPLVLTTDDGYSPLIPSRSRIMVCTEPTLMPTSVCVCGGGVVDIFSSSIISLFSSLSLSLYLSLSGRRPDSRLKYCLKGPFSPKQPIFGFESQIDTAFVVMLQCIFG